MTVRRELDLKRRRELCSCREDEVLAKRLCNGAGWNRCRNSRLSNRERNRQGCAGKHRRRRDTDRSALICHTSAQLRRLGESPDLLDHEQIVDADKLVQRDLFSDRCCERTVEANGFESCFVAACTPANIFVRVSLCTDNTSPHARAQAYFTQCALYLNPDSTCSLVRTSQHF